MSRSINMEACFSEGYQCFRINPGLAIGGFFLYFVITVIGGLIPIINIIFNLFILPPLAGGMYKLGMNLCRGTNPRLEDLFYGFQRYGAMMGIYYLAIVAFWVGMIPSLVLSFLSQPTPDYWGPLQITLIVVNVIAILILFLRYSMVYFILVDEPETGVMDALRKSARLTDGHLLILALFLIVIGVASTISVLMLIIPFFIVTPILYLAFARAYMHLRVLAHEPEPPQGMAGPTPPPPPAYTPPPPTSTPPESPPPGTPPDEPPTRTA